RGQDSGEKRRGFPQVRKQGDEAWRNGEEEGCIENAAQDFTQTCARQQQGAEARRSFRCIEEGAFETRPQGGKQTHGKPALRCGEKSGAHQRCESPLGRGSQSRPYACEKEQTMTRTGHTVCPIRFSQRPETF